MGQKATTLQQVVASSSDIDNNNNNPLFINCTREEYENFLQLIAIKSSQAKTIIWKLNDEENTQFYLHQSSSLGLIREENKSWLERELPSEIIFEILNYLLPEDLIKLSGCSWNFRAIWTEHPLLWCNHGEKSENKSLLSREIVEGFINNNAISLNNYVSNWKQLYLQIKSVLIYPNSFSNFANECVKYGRIYGEYSNIQKIGFIGMKGCGKSTFCKLLATNTLDLEMKTTIGCDFYVQYLNLDLMENNQKVQYCYKLEIWDIGYLFPHLYRGLHTIYFCFDLSNEESLHHMLNLFKEGCSNELYVEDFNNLQNELSNDTKIVFLGLKKDCKTISNNTINNCISPFIDLSIPYNQRRVAYFEVSTKENDKTTFYPISFIGFPKPNGERYFPTLTPLTKDNEERFRNYGALY